MPASADRSVIRILHLAYNHVIRFLLNAYSEIDMPAPTLVIQTVYAELLERCAIAAFSQSFPEKGVFTPKEVGGRRYWYFQTGSAEERAQKYVGPETPELLEQIKHHKAARDDERERRSLVSTLVRSFRLPRPIPEIGNVVEALAEAGVFRLRGVLVGTVAYQTYSAMLGARLPLAVLQTGDVFKNVSVAVDDNTPPMLAVLRKADPTFREVPHVSDGRRVASYAAKGGLRVDFLTPNEGAETDRPQRLPAYQTDAQPLRFLDYLIHEPEPAIILHGAGVYVHVPAPERFAVHKLIISRRRPAGKLKREKDIKQAEALLSVLMEKRPQELKIAWREAYERGQTWRKLLAEGMSELAPKIRDEILKAVDASRWVLPALDLAFSNPHLAYDSEREVVTFVGEALGSPVHCAISREALDDHFGADDLGQKGLIERVRKNRSKIEQMARTKFLSWRVEEPEAVLIRTDEVPQLLKKSKSHRPSRAKARAR